MGSSLHSSMRRGSMPAVRATWISAMLLVLLCVHPARALQSVKTLTLDAGGCQGLEWKRLGEKYGYTAKLTSLQLPAGCGAGEVRISKLYVQDACVDRRDNNWEVKLEKEHLLCNKVLYGDTTTCKQVMQYGPPGATLAASSLSAATSGGAALDKDNVCYNTDHAFVFVSNNCSQPIDVEVALETVSYAGERCVVVEGHALGVAGIIGVAIAAAVVLLILSTAIKCLCCCL